MQKDVQVGPYPNKARAAWGRRAHKLESVANTQEAASASLTSG